MMRRGQQGVCVDCAAVLFLQRLANMHVPGAILGGPSGREALRLPHVQQQFAMVMRAGNADADPDEINWERVIDLWDVGPAAKGTLF